MLITVSEVKGCSIEATDGELGRVTDLYFDDSLWTIRYLVIETGSWFESRKVLISPISIAQDARLKEKRILVDLTQDQVRNSPSFDSEKPISRQYEESYHDYYAWPYYWGYPGIWGSGIHPYALRERQVDESINPFVADRAEEDSNLRSANEVNGYSIETRDGRMGHVEDFLFDDETWTIRYLVIDTVSWWPSKKVLVSPSWATNIDWNNRTLHVDMTKEKVKESPDFDPEKFDREYEQNLHAHYDRTRYWDDIEEYKDRSRPLGTM